MTAELCPTCGIWWRGMEHVCRYPIYSTSTAGLSMVEHGYTCGICSWGRVDQPRNLADYVEHMNADHPVGPLLEGDPEREAGGLTLRQARRRAERIEAGDCGTWHRILRETPAGLVQLRGWRSCLPRGIQQSLAAQGMDSAI